MSKADRRRWRMLSGGAAVAAATVTMVGGGAIAAQASPSTSAPLAAAKAAAAGCTVRRLPDNGTGKAIVTAGDPSGHYIAGRIYPGEQIKQSVIWKDGEIQPGGTLPGDDPRINDLNTKGVAVGQGWPDWNNPLPYMVRQDGAIHRLAGGIGAAEAINDAGVMVGETGEYLMGAPVRWASTFAEPEKLPLPEGAAYGSAEDIDSDGTIVGLVGERDYQRRTGYLWLPDGTHRRMALPEVDGRKASFFWPDSISNGVVFGRAVMGEPEDENFVAMRYRITSGTFEQMPGQIRREVYGAEDGSAAGTMVADASTGIERPVLISTSGLTMLPVYKQARPEANYSVGSFSADGHTIAGYTTDDDPSAAEIVNMALVWTCR